MLYNTFQTKDSIDNILYYFNRFRRNPRTMGVVDSHVVPLDFAGTVGGIGYRVKDMYFGSLMKQKRFLGTVLRLTRCGGKNDRRLYDNGAIGGRDIAGCPVSQKIGHYSNDQENSCAKKSHLTQQA